MRLPTGTTDGAAGQKQLRGRLGMVLAGIQNL